MKFPVMLFAVMALGFTGCSSSTGLYRWIPFVGHAKSQGTPKISRVDRSNPNGPITGPVVYGVELRIRTAPPIIKLSDTRSFEAHLVLINRTKKTVTLIFNDSRHYDFLLRDATGRKLAQWSDDQPLNQNPGYTIINPQERAEFIGNISTRDMVAGRTYTLDGFVAGYDTMRLSTQLTVIP